MSDNDDESSIISNSDYDSSDEDSSNCYKIGLIEENLNESFTLGASVLDEIFTEDMMKIADELRSDNDSLYFDFGACNQIYLSDQSSQCTYKEGYMKRQNLYTCVDCNSNNNQLSAICFACALCCHRKHTIIELYSKRNFRCDCGNEKFELFTCKLCPEKELFNKNNVYNDNFSGVYCVCKQPYDNNSRDGNDIMIQCIICEDWYHTKHLDVEPPKESSDGKFNFDEFICFVCANKYAYLTKYIADGTNKELKQKKLDTNSNHPLIDTPNNKCAIMDVPLKLPYTSLYYYSGWRDKLCRCDDCMKNYQYHQHMFLLDSDDVQTNNNEMIDSIHSLANTPESEIVDEKYQIDLAATSLPVVNSTLNSTNVDNDISKQIENPTITNDKTENKLPSDPNINKFIKNIQHTKKSVKVNNQNNVINEYPIKKRPKYDDNQNL